MRTDAAPAASFGWRRDPARAVPNTYNGQPLCYAALAAQKNHNALYLTDVYQDPSQGKSGLRFQKTEDLELEVIGEIISRTLLKGFIARYEAGRRGRSSGSTRTAERKRRAKA